MFDLQLIEKRDGLLRLDKVWKKGRVYVLVDDIARTVTTFISATNFLKNTKTAEEMAWLPAWRARVGPQEADRQAKRATVRGTALHAMYEDFLLNKPIRKTNNAEAKFQFSELSKEFTKHVTRVYGTEVQLHSTLLQIAGTTDAVVDWDGELAILDHKTSTKQKKIEYIGDYFLQCLLYAIMYEEMYNVRPKKLVVSISCTNGDSQVFVVGIDPYIKPLMARYNRAIDSGLFASLPQLTWDEMKHD